MEIKIRVFIAKYLCEINFRKFKKNQNVSMTKWKIYSGVNTMRDFGYVVMRVVCLYKYTSALLSVFYVICK